MVFPTEPQNKVAETKRIVKAMIEKYNISLISVGNGTASRESELVIVDMEKEMVFTEDMIQCKNKWSPFIGRTFKGCPVMTLVRGKTVAKDFKLTGEKGYGHYIARPKF